MSTRDLTILGCSSQQPTRFRNHGAYLLRWNGEGLLLDPGEGTQRQFIFANIAPPVVTRILISHFHGDHCLGVGSMLMRLNLDKVTHPIHCYYPARGKKFFDRLRYCCMYKENIHVIEHPVEKEGLVEERGKFRIEAYFLDHGVENVGWRITEPDVIRFHKEELKKRGIEGPQVRVLEKEGSLQGVRLEEVSHVQKGAVFSYVVDTRPCRGAFQAAEGADLLLSESTYLESERALAHEYKHMTARQAAELAQKAGAKHLVLTHFSARYRDLAPFAQEAGAIFPNVRVADDLLQFPIPKNSSH